MTGTRWVGTILQIRAEVRFQNAPNGIFTGATQRGRSAEIRKTPRVIGADRHASLTWSDQVARVDGEDIESWTNAQASGTFTYFRHAVRVLPHATEQLGRLGNSQNRWPLRIQDNRFFERNCESPSCRLPELTVRGNAWLRSTACSYKFASTSAYTRRNR